jgi:hypothetical protein
VVIQIREKSDYLGDNLMQKPFSGKGKVFFLKERIQDFITRLGESAAHSECNRLPRSYFTTETAKNSSRKRNAQAHRTTPSVHDLFDFLGGHSQHYRLI